MSRVRARVLKRTTIDGTIDGHDFLCVVLRVTGGLRPFRLVLITANLGRTYTPAVFKRNVMRLLEHVTEPQHVILFLQEIDEADPVEEHEKLLRWLEPDTTLVGWATREPIAVSPGIPVTRKRRTLLMASGLAIGAPEGTGPDRQLVSCIATIEGVKIGAMNRHPHRDLRNDKVQHARRRGERVAKRVASELVELCDLVVDAGDYNDENPPKDHPEQRTLIQRGPDAIRLTVA